MDMSLVLAMGAMLLVIGAFAGVLAGLLGVGGGIILVPAFFYAFQVLGFDSPQLMQMCLGTSLATIIVTSVRSVLAHNKKGCGRLGDFAGLGAGDRDWCGHRLFHRVFTALYGVADDLWYSRHYRGPLYGIWQIALADR